MQATMTKAEAEMTRMESKLANETEIARAKRDFDLKKASYDVEVDTARWVELNQKVIVLSGQLV
jgi:flotillin